MEIVVAHYKENIDWIYKNDLQNDVILFDKGNNIINKKYKEYIQLENVGREGHTYLHYIINAYYNLPEIIIFTQGNPFDHSKNFIEKIKNIDNLMVNKNFVFLGDKIYKIKNFSCIHHKNIPIQNICHALFVNPLADFEFSPGAIFAVKKNAILSKSIDFYEKCISMLENNINPIEGYVFERIWELIFNEKFDAL